MPWWIWGAGGHVRTPAPDWDLLLCTLDKELTVLPPGADPASHPRWVESAAVPAQFFRRVACLLVQE